jgi:hypothetical protein
VPEVDAGSRPDGNGLSSVDASSDMKAAATDAGSGAPADAFQGAPLTECPGPSIDRLQKWLAHAFVMGAPPLQETSILVSEGNHYVAKASLTGGGANYSEIVVLIGNDRSVSVDLTKTAGFVLTYAATVDQWIELRGTVHPDGGDQWVVKLPTTGGQMMSRTFSFDATSWTTLFGQPPVAFRDVLRTAFLFDIVGNASGMVTFFGLRFDGYVPTCR